MQQSRGRKDEVAAVTADELRSQLILKRMVGRGGFAAVFLGTYNGQEVAVKVILAEHVTPDSLQVKLLLREGQYMSRCTHRAIVKCHAVCQLPADFPGIEALGHRTATWALVLEYIGGGSMASLLMKQMSQTRKAYSDYEAYCWVRDVAEALSYLHNAPRPVMHRDVKADNVLLTTDEAGRPTAKLMDFGLMAALDGKNPMLRRRSISQATRDGLGRSSARSVGRTSVGGPGGYNLAAPSVATYYNDSTHEAGKIFYLMDELPVATVAALTASSSAQRRPSMELANLVAATGAGAAGGAGGGNTAGTAAGGTTATGGSPAGPTSPNTQIGFNAVEASSTSSSAAAAGVTSPGASGGGGSGGGGGTGGGVPWNSKTGSRAAGTGTGMGGLPSFGTLVPLNEEASYHGNTAGYAAMLLHQQQARRQQKEQQQKEQQQQQARRQGPDSATGTGSSGAAKTPTAGSAADSTSTSTSLHSLMHAGSSVGGGGGAAGGGGGASEGLRLPHLRAASLPNSLHGASPPNRSGFTDSPYGPGITPESGCSPAASSRWNAVTTGDGTLNATSVRLRMVSDDPSSSGVLMAPGGGGDAAIAAAAARLSRPVSAEKNGSLVRMSAPMPVGGAPSTPEAELASSYADEILRETTRSQAAQTPPPPPSRPASAAMDIGQVIATARRTGSGDGGATQGGGDGACGSAPPHPHPRSLPPLTPLGAGSSPRTGGGDAVPMVDIGGGRAVTVGAAASAASAPVTGPSSLTSPLTPAGVAGNGNGVSANGLVSRQASQRSVGSNSRLGVVNGGGGGGGTDGGGPVTIAAMLQGRYELDFQWVWRLTGQTGSCMYMAPEVFRNMPYNEKVDVFSFGVLAYEVFSRTLTLVAGLNLRELRLKGMQTPEGYAEFVADGYRPAKPVAMPEDVFELISACWSEDPCERPVMADVVETLKVLQERYAPRPSTAVAAPECGCVIS